MTGKRKYFFGSTKISVFKLSEKINIDCENCGDKGTHFVGVGGNSLFDEPQLHNKVCCWRCVQQLHHGDYDIVSKSVIIDVCLMELNEIEPMGEN